ncbi:MAG: RNA ligase, DRB0094 family [Candidatus Woesebacteria bacterium GW2011_GWB1_39_12]|uniref:RNA ligase, DRB0094 family n=1 Tax=Candidatus Woesebacteria bacterium GW2011_GWB1_39_12 TaxID=1618574 RepID=A0A0G0MHP2_9BACT|nr:MAG: RNA ligase, DRB0094 family [Candidatus Woesebacteria bacterium GW2011_GWB1_39_12]
MSELFVKPVVIDSVSLHENADNLAVYKVGGWQVIDKKDAYNPGDVVIHVPGEVMVPVEISDKWGVTKYLSFTKGSKEGRVRTIKLRGVISYGFFAQNEDNDPVGIDLKDKFGIFKYEPPAVFRHGEQEKRHPLFNTDYDIENMRNYPLVFEDGEEVVATEKLHGTNSSYAYAKDPETDEWIYMCASKGGRRKIGVGSIYEKPYELYPSLRHMMKSLAERNSAMIVIVRGEVFGDRIQNLSYSHRAGSVDWRCFDIEIDHRFLSHRAMCEVCEMFGIPVVPEIYSGPFSFAKMEELAEGNSIVSTEEQIREGCVIRPMIESTHPDIGRKILKMISGSYLASQKRTEHH